MQPSRDWLKKAVELLDNNKLQYRNTIIIGDNATGKSEVIKCFVSDKLKANEFVYFLDAVNRCFKVSLLSDSLKNIVFSNRITETRIDDENFNLKDTWSYYGTATECIEMVYYSYEPMVQELFSEFAANKFHVHMKETGEVLFQTGGVGRLSSGYQALIRIFLELCYVQNTTQNTKEKVIVIDEIDEYLSPKNCGKLYSFLTKYFPDMNFIFTTHSSDFIAGAYDANIIILKNADIEILDANDYKDINDVMAVFKEVFDNNKRKLNTKRQEEILRSLLNNRISGIWGEEEEKSLETLKETELSAAQRLIYRQIKEW